MQPTTRSGRGGAFRFDSGGELALFQTALVGNFASATAARSRTAAGLHFSRVARERQPRGGGKSRARRRDLVHRGPGATFTRSIPRSADCRCSRPPVGDRGGGIYVWAAPPSRARHDHRQLGRGGRRPVRRQRGQRHFRLDHRREPGSRMRRPVDQHDRRAPQLSDDTSCQFDAEGDRQGVDRCSRRSPTTVGRRTPTRSTRAARRSMASSAVTARRPTSGSSRGRPAVDIGAFEGSIASPSPRLAAATNCQPPPPLNDEEEAAAAGRRQERQRRAGGRHGQGQAEGDDAVRRARARASRSRSGRRSTPEGPRDAGAARAGCDRRLLRRHLQVRPGRGPKPSTTLTLIERLELPQEWEGERGGEEEEEAQAVG